MWDVGCGVLDDLLEMQNRLILKILLPQDLPLIVMSLGIFVILFELLIEVDNSLIVVLKLVQKYGPLEQCLVSASGIYGDRVIIGLESTFEVAYALHRVRLPNVARPIIGLEVYHILEVNQGLLEFLQVDVDLPTGLVGFHVFGEFLNTFRKGSQRRVQVVFPSVGDG